MDEKNHVLFRHALIHELKNHKSDYLRYLVPRRFLNLSWMVYTLQLVEVGLRMKING